MKKKRWYLRKLGERVATALTICGAGSIVSGLWSEGGIYAILFGIAIIALACLIDFFLGE